jgi:hypothetical protein
MTFLPLKSSPLRLVTAICIAAALICSSLSMLFTLRDGDIPAQAGRLVRPAPLYTGPEGFFRAAAYRASGAGGPSGLQEAV